MSSTPPMMTKHRFLSVSLSATVAAVLSAILILGILLPYVRHNAVAQWDSPGHLFSAWYINEHLFPRGTGWNPMFFGGFPQGTFYPFLFHYLVAVLGYAIPLTLAFKLIVASAILLTPLSFFYFCRSIQLSRDSASVASVWMFTLLVLPIAFDTTNNSVGGTLLSTFRVGLISNAFALPVLFFYMGSLIQRPRVLVPSVLLSVLILSHLLAAVVGVLFALVVAFLYLRDSAFLRSIVLHGILALLATAFWVVPFLTYLGYSDSIRLTLHLGSGALFCLSVGVAVLILQYARGRGGEHRILTTWFVVLLVSVLLSSALPFRLHYYRFILYPVLLVPILVVTVLPKRSLWPAAGVACLACLYFITSGPPYGLRDVFPGPDVERLQYLDGPPDGRTLLVANASEQPCTDCVHSLQHTLPRETRTSYAKGLFVESALNARFFLTLENLMDPWAMVWGVPIPNLSAIGPSRKQALIRRNLDRLGITSVVSARDLPELDSLARVLFFATEAPAQYHQFALGESALLVRTWNDQRYVSIDTAHVVFVTESIDRTQFDIFDGVSLASHSRARLRTPEYTYYVRRLQQEIWALDFILPSTHGAQSTSLEIVHLRQLIEALPVDSPNKLPLLSAIESVEDEYYDLSATFAMTHYDTSPLIDLNAIGSNILLAQQAEAITAVRRIEFANVILPRTALIEVMSPQYATADGDWDEIAMRWFLSTAATDHLLLGPIDAAITADAIIDNLRFTPTMERIYFTVRSSAPTLVKIKVSYFPKWRARVNGRSVPIYRAAPNFMAIAAVGEVELEYEDSPLERVALWVSALSWLGLAALLLPRKARRAKSESPPAL